MRRQIRFSQATLCSLLHIHSIPPLTRRSCQAVGLLQELGLELTRDVHGQRLSARSGGFCQPLVCYWNPTDEHMLLTFGFLRACPFVGLLGRNTVHLSRRRDEGGHHTAVVLLFRPPAVPTLRLLTAAVTVVCAMLVSCPAPLPASCSLLLLCSVEMRHDNPFISSSPRLSGLPPRHRRAAGLGGSGCQGRGDAVPGGSEVPGERG